MTEKVDRAQRATSTDNTVELRGRVSSAPVERELPSGARDHDVPAVGAAGEDAR